MEVKLGTTKYFDFTTHDPSTGAVSNADSTPTAVIYEDNATADMSGGTSVAQISTNTGEYRVTAVCTAGNGYEAGKIYKVMVSATVNSIDAKAVVATFQIKANDIDNVKADTSAILNDTSEIQNLFDGRFQKVSRITNWSIAVGSSDSFPHAAGTSGIEILNSASAFVWDEGQSSFGEWDINTEIYTDNNPGQSGYISLSSYLWSSGVMTDDVVIKLEGTFEYGALPSYIYVAIPKGWSGDDALVGIDGRLYGGHRGEKGGPSPLEIMEALLLSTGAKDATVAKEATLTNRPTLAEIEASTVLAKKSDLNAKDVSSVTYTPQNKVDIVTHTDGSTIQMTYDGSGRLISVNYTP